MTRQVKVEDLREGMYVILPSSWGNHPFLFNRFLIKDQEQLNKLRHCGFRSVEVDFAKSTHPEPPLKEVVTEAEELPYVSHNDDPQDPSSEAPAKWDSSSAVPRALIDAIEDRSLPPEVKSQAVYRHSVEMMERMLENPSVENIHDSKQAVHAITEMILSDDETAHNMLRITSHDFYTYTHSVNVGITGIMLAKELFRGSDRHDLPELGAGFFLHDLGKVMVNPDVINKPGKLEEAEMRHMRIHPYQGYKILKEANALTEECRLIVMQHHEMLNGKGYPKRLQEDEIHIYGRICCIVDIFDALTAERSYKKAMTPFEALRFMKEKMSNQIDMDIFRTFVKLYH